MKVAMYTCRAAWLCVGLYAGTARAEEFDGVKFPAGVSSFADRVVSYDLGDGEDVEAPFDDPTRALGPPDYVSNSTPNYVALGNVPADGQPSELVLEFVDNRLIDVEGDDLYVFEVGSQAEPTQIAISSDGETWFELGRIEGSTRGIDLADHPDVPEGGLFRFVLLRDVPGGGGSSAPYGGPDIDAIGAIGSDVSDADEDGVHDAGDNCPDVDNADQADGDADDVGDACDACVSESGAATDDGCPLGAGGAGGASGDDTVGGAGGGAGEPTLAGGSGGGGQGGTDPSAGGAGPATSTSTATQTNGASPTNATNGSSGGSVSEGLSTSGSGDDTDDQSEASASCQCSLEPTNSGFTYTALLGLLGLVACRRRRRACSP